MDRRVSRPRQSGRRGRAERDLDSQIPSSSSSATSVRRIERTRIGLTSLTLEDVLAESSDGEASDSSEEESSKAPPLLNQSSRVNNDRGPRSGDAAVQRPLGNEPSPVRDPDRGTHDTDTIGSRRGVQPRKNISRSVSFSLQSQTRSFSIENPPSVLGDVVMEDTKTRTPPPRPRQQLNPAVQAVPSLAQTYLEDDQAFSFIDEFKVNDIPGEMVHVKSESILDQPDDGEGMSEPIEPTQLDNVNNDDVRPLVDVLREVGGWVPGILFDDRSGSASEAEREMPTIEQRPSLQGDSVIQQDDGSSSMTEVRQGADLMNDGNATEVVETSEEMLEDDSPRLPETVDLYVSSTEVEESGDEVGPESPLDQQNLRQLADDGYDTERVESSTEEDEDPIHSLERRSTASTVVIDSIDNDLEDESFGAAGKNDTSNGMEPSGMYPSVLYSPRALEELNVACEMVRLSRSESEPRSLAATVHGVVSLVLLDLPRYTDNWIPPKLSWELGAEVDHETEAKSSDMIPYEARTVVDFPHDSVMAGNDTLEGDVSEARTENDNGADRAPEEVTWAPAELEEPVNTSFTANDQTEEPHQGFVPESYGEQWHPDDIGLPSSSLDQSAEAPTPSSEQQSHQQAREAGFILRADTFEEGSSIFSSHPLDLSHFIHLCTFSPSSDRSRKLKTKSSSSRLSSNKKKRYPVHSLAHFDAKRVQFT